MPFFNTAVPIDTQIIKNIFSERQLSNILKLADANKKILEKNNFVGAYGTGIQEDYGRLRISSLELEPAMINIISNLVNSLIDEEVWVDSPPLYAEYSNVYGRPSLPPHFDGDSTEIIVDFQLSSNITWPIGVGKEIYELEDNSALIFNPNADPHWRTIKDFEDGEYVKMLFFRCFKVGEKFDYSDRRLSIHDKIFKDINILRKSENDPLFKIPT